MALFSMRTARGFFVSFAMVMGGTIGSVIGIVPALLLRVVSDRLYLQYANVWLASFLTFVGDMTYHMLRYRPRITFDEPSHGIMDTSESAVIIMNHRSYIDWLHFLELLHRRGGSSARTRIVLKNELMLCPGLGWCMYLLGFAFVARFWEHDKSVLEQCVYMTTEAHSKPGWVIIYPEGTTLQSKSKARNHAWQKERGIKPWNHCLTPRAKGFLHLLRQFKTPPAVYDLTVAYTQQRHGKRRPGPLDLPFARMPDTHIHMRRFGPEDYPSSGTDDELTTWLRARFAEKETRLAHFMEGTPPKECPQGGFSGIVGTSQPRSLLLRVPNFLLWLFLCFVQFVWLYRYPYFRTWYIIAALSQTLMVYRASRARSNKDF